MSRAWIRAARFASAVVLAAIFGRPALAEELASAGPGAPGPRWALAGSARVTAEGIALTAGPGETGAIRFVDPIPLDRVTVRLEVILDEAAACGADGFAIVLGAEPISLADGGSALGFGGASGMGIAVEFDLWGNPGADPGLPGPAGAHVGIAAAEWSFPPGPAVARAWAPLSLGAGRWRIEVARVDDHVVVRGGPAEERLAIWLDAIAELPPLAEGYAMVAAATGSLGGGQTLGRIEIARPAAAPPRIRGAWEETGLVRIAWDEPTPLAAIEVYRDGERIGEVPGGRGGFAEPLPALGDHLYELRGRSEAGEVAPTRVRFVAGPQALVFDPIGRPGAEGPAAAAIAEALRGEGIVVTVARDLAGLDLAPFSSIWWANGSFPRQHIPSAEEEARLLAYLEGARPDLPRALYLEGGDLFSFLPRHALAERDGVAGIDDGGDEAIAGLRAAAEGLPDVAYEGPSYEVDRIAPAPGECEPCEATVLYEDLRGAALAIGVADEGEGRRLIASSIEIRGIPASARREVLRVYGAFLGLPPGAPSFIRGDASGDGRLDIGDGIATLNYLFAGGALSSCPDAADANDGGSIEIGDAIYVFNALFADAVLPPPGLVCGPDRTADLLGPCAHPYCR